jgi:3-oxoacyl-[acyl-carrier protein] reductase
VIDTNLLGTFHTPGGPHMLRQRWGRIVNVVSPSGLIATAGQTAYSASKAGVIGLTRTLAAECGRRGVTVNALSPGFMVTGMTKDLPAAVTDNIRSKCPVPRFGTPEEVARTIGLFLDTDYMTGQVVSIDGGVSITWAPSSTAIGVAVPATRQRQGRCSPMKCQNRSSRYLAERFGIF